MRPYTFLPLLALALVACQAEGQLGVEADPQDIQDYDGDGIPDDVDTDDDNDGIPDDEDPDPTGTTGDTGDTTDTGDTGDPTDPLDVDDDNDGFTENEGDCDDTQPAINPYATDLVGDTVDQNCDGVDGTDSDQDGYASELSGGDDCDDSDNLVFPGAIEVWYDGIPQDCDDWDDPSWQDGDQDGDGYLSTFVGGDDCVDTNADASPGTPDINGNGIDDNCNGQTDGAGATVTWFGIAIAGDDNDEDGIPDNWTGTEPVLELVLTDMPANEIASLCVRDAATSPAALCGGEFGETADTAGDSSLTVYSIEFTEAGADWQITPNPSADKTFALYYEDGCVTWGYDTSFYTSRGCVADDPTLW